MKKIEITPYDLAKRYVGIREIPGQPSHPLISWWLSLCELGFADDAVPWCSGFVNGVCWELEAFGIQRSTSAAARSWLSVGAAVPRELAVSGFDVVVLKRGHGPQPGPDVLKAPGHVGFFGWLSGRKVHVLGGNQGDAVSIAAFPETDILGIRRLGG